MASASNATTMSTSIACAQPEEATGVVLEFPSCDPQRLSSEHVSLESLVHHRQSVAHDLPLEEVHRLLRDRDLNFAALVRDGVVSVICSRERIGILLGARFGFALHSRDPASRAQVAHPLVFDRSTPMREILDRAFARREEEFHEDVALVDAHGQLLGLVPVHALAQLQSRLVGEQLAALRRQHEMLQQNNLALFKANHALRQAQGLYEGLFESDALGVALLDGQGNVQTHNRRLAEFFGLGDGPVAPFSLAPWIAERERPHFTELLRQHEHENHGSITREFHVDPPGRGPRLFRFSTGWIRETGQVCVCVDDITEQRSLEQQMQRQDKQVLLDTLVGGIAHELNNKLTPVLGFAGLLGTAGAESERSYVSYITKSVSEAAGMIRQLLQLSKPHEGDLQFTHLLQSVEEALVMLKFQLREHGVLTRVLKPSEPVMVLADHGQIKQVVINLVMNAIQAMEGRAAPTLEVEVGREREHAFIAVRDNGTGISREIIGRIFDPFFTTKRPDRGTGLGLSICFSIIRQHGGDLTVESEPGCGATFKATLPLTLATLPDVIVAGGKSTRVAGRPGRFWHRRTLVVEDEEVVRRLLQETLRSHFGCTVDSVSDGGEGLRRAEAFDYDLIISDIRMPGMDGPEFYRRLRQSRPALARRVVFVTGYIGDRDQSEEIAGWRVPVVAKPFTIDHLVEICSPFLNAKGRAADAGS